MLGGEGTIGRVERARPELYRLRSHFHHRLISRRRASLASSLFVNRHSHSDGDERGGWSEARRRSLAEEETAMSAVSTGCTYTNVDTMLDSTWSRAHTLR